MNSKEEYVAFRCDSIAQIRYLFISNQLDQENVDSCDCQCAELELERKSAYKFAANSRVPHKAASQGKAQAEGYATKAGIMRGDGER